MTRNFKALWLALLAVCALCAVAAQGASAAQEHEFHTENERSIGTGKNKVPVKLQVGAAGTIECSTLTTEGTQIGALVSANTYKSDTITVKPHMSGCTFGGQPATVNFNHCAYILDSDTTTGHAAGGEHANLEIECAEGQKVEVHSAVCTITFGAQLVKHAVRYKNATGFETTAEKVVSGKARTTASQPVNGCLTFPTGAIGTVTSNVINECFEDAGSELTGTEKTTPTGLTTEGESIGCTVSPGA